KPHRPRGHREERNEKTEGQRLAERRRKWANTSGVLEQLVDGSPLGEDEVRSALMVQGLLGQVNVEMAVDGGQHVVRSLGQILGTCALGTGAADGPTTLNAAPSESGGHYVGPVIPPGFLVDDGSPPDLAPGDHQR